MIKKMFYIMWLQVLLLNELKDNLFGDDGMKAFAKAACEGAFPSLRLMYLYGTSAQVGCRGCIASRTLFKHFRTLRLRDQVFLGWFCWSWTSISAVRHDCVLQGIQLEMTPGCTEQTQYLYHWLTYQVDWCFFCHKKAWHDDHGVFKQTFSSQQG